MCSNLDVVGLFRVVPLEKRQYNKGHRKVGPAPAGEPSDSSLPTQKSSYLKSMVSKLEAETQKDASELSENITSAKPKKQIEVVSIPYAASVRRKARGRSSSAALEEAQLSLFSLQQQGRFSVRSVDPQSEFPTLLTRLPVFVPGTRKGQRDMLDEDLAIPFVTPWGEGKKYGPPLTVYDEDTLIAIGHLRTNQIVGKPSTLPIPVSETSRHSNETDVSVHVVQCTLHDIQSMCGTSIGGLNNALRLESIKRLAATTLELTKQSNRKGASRGTTIKLIDVLWDAFDENAILYLQFSPVMAVWFEKEYTYIDWSVRRQLPDTAKAIHRFLSGQPHSYSIGTRKLMATIGYCREYKAFMRDLKLAMKQMEKLGWLNAWSISGSGRRTPHILHTTRSRGGSEKNTEIVSK